MGKKHRLDGSCELHRKRCKPRQTCQNNTNCGYVLALKLPPLAKSIPFLVIYRHDL